MGRKTLNKGIPGLEKIDTFNIFTNFKHYKLPTPDFFVQDCANMMIRKGTVFDAIICDPPYGVRARS